MVFNKLDVCNKIAKDLKPIHVGKADKTFKTNLSNGSKPLEKLDARKSIADAYGFQQLDQSAKATAAGST